MNENETRTEKKMTGKEKAKAMLKALENGATIVIATYTKAWQIDKNTADKFARVGRPIFKGDTKSLYMAQGKGYVCIDFCSIKAYK
jgi:hypothetical protein